MLLTFEDRQLLKMSGCPDAKGVRKKGGQEQNLCPKFIDEGKRIN
jgi:hypothetical protein